MVLEEKENGTLPIVENTKIEETKNEVIKDLVVKTFTQEELDEIVKSRVAREKENIPNDVDLKGFKQWKKDQQKTNIVKEVEDNSLLNETRSELELYKLQAQPEFMEFLISKISKDGNDFKATAEEFKKNNPQYFCTPKSRKFSSAPKLNGNVKTAQTTNELMNSFLRGEA